MDNFTKKDTDLVASEIVLTSMDLPQSIKEKGYDEQSPLPIWKDRLINLALKYKVLCLGKYTLKSGRVSPYFVNLGRFSSGFGFRELCFAYANRIMDSGIQFDVIFGLAYKGISIAAGVAMILAEQFDKDIPFCFNRKEEKLCGEGGSLIGAIDSLNNNAKVLLMDDVITAGTSIGEAVERLKAYECEIVGAVICVDREETVNLNRLGTARYSAATSIENYFGFPVLAVMSMSDILAFLRREISIGRDEYVPVVEQMEVYRNTYGA